MSPHIREYRLFTWLAVLHSVILVGWLIGAFDRGPWWLDKAWVGFATLWLFWLPVLAIHPGRSVRRLLLPLVVAAPLLFVCARWYALVGPHALGLPPGVTLSPRSIIQYASAYHAGRTSAAKDVAAGQLTIEVYGLGAGHDFYAKTLQERYQIQPKVVADCLVDEQILGHAAGYNSVSEAEIERRFGSGTLAVLHEETQRHYAAHPNE